MFDAVMIFANVRRPSGGNHLMSDVVVFSQQLDSFILSNCRSPA